MAATDTSAPALTEARDLLSRAQDILEHVDDDGRSTVLSSMLARWNEADQSGPCWSASNLLDTRAEAGDRVAELRKLLCAVVDDCCTFAEGHNSVHPDDAIRLRHNLARLQVEMDILVIPVLAGITYEPRFDAS